MRYLFIHQNFPGQFRHVAPALAVRGHEVVALSARERLEELPGVRQLRYGVQPLPRIEGDHPLAGPSNEWNEKSARGLAVLQALEQLRDQQGFSPDVIAVHSGWGEALFVKDVFPQARLVVYAEYYYGGEGGDVGFDKEFTAPVTPRSMARVRVRNTHLLHALSVCDVALTPTAFQASRHPAWVQPRMRVIHEGIDTDRFRPDPAAHVQLQAAGVTLRAGDEVVTFVSRQLEPYRGYHTFMRALPLLQKLRPNARFLIVGGDGCSYGVKPPTGQSWRNILLNQVANRLDKSRVHFVGTLPHALLTRAMQVSAVHVYLTYPFVLSWSLLEAMSIGCLIVGSDTAPLREVVTHGETGLLTDFFDHERLARTVADALERREELQPLRDAARRLIVDQYDLQRHCLPALVELFEQG